MCIPGFYCKEGAAEPVPCPAGYVGNATGLYSPGQCTPVPIGFYAPLGSQVPESCPASGFYCPGTLRDDVHGGAKPVIMPVGQSTEIKEVATVQQKMTIDLSLDGFAAQRDALIQRLAQQSYGVDPALITLEAKVARRRLRALQSGSLELTITISTSDGSGNEVDITTIETAAAALDATTLTTTISEVTVAAGLPPVTVTALQAPERATAAIEVPFSCPKGKWCTAGLVVDCAFGFYNPLNDRDFATACLPCPPNAKTLVQAATSRSQCVCAIGYYDTNNGSLASDPELLRVYNSSGIKALNVSSLAAAVNCQTCVTGFDCTAESTVRTLQTLSTRPGYWRPTLSLDARRCPDASENCGGLSECPESSSGCRENGTDPCRFGLAGAFCRLCSPQNASAPPMYYQQAEGAREARCDPCKKGIGPTLAVGLLSVLLVLMVAQLLIQAQRRMAQDPVGTKRLAQLSHIHSTYTLNNKLKILVGFYMIATKIEVVYEVRFPEEIRTFYMRLSNAITLGIDVGLEVTPLACMGLNGYLWQMLFWMLLPLGLVGCVFVGTAAWLSVRRKALGAITLARWLTAAAPLSVRFLFLAYPIVTRQAFEAFSFFDFDKEGIRYLRADVSLIDGTPELAAAQSVAVVAIFLYPIGLLLAFGVLLIRARHAIRAGKSTQLTNAIAFLYSEYEPRFFYWELIEMARRFVLVGFFVVVPRQGTVEQLAYGALVSTMYLALQVSAAPFKRPSDNFLAVVCSLLLAFLYICAIFYKFGALTDVVDLQRVMSNEQKVDFRPPFATLTTFSASASFGAAFMLAIILAAQATNQALQAHIAARAARARRLRYVKDDGEVLLPELEPLDKQVRKFHPHTPPGDTLPAAGPFHVFLSHNWQHGQSAMRIVKTRLKEMLPDCEVFLDVDNLGGGSDHPHIDVSDCMLCFCTRHWITNMPCVTEMIRCVLRKKPCIALFEPDTSDQNGGHTEQEVRELLLSDMYKGKIANMEDQIAQWAVEWGIKDLKPPTCKEVVDALFASTPIIWYRLADPQDISMRLIAERLLPSFSHAYGSPYTQLCYVQDELEKKVTGADIKLASFREGRRFHLYCSPNNPGALGIAKELQAVHPGIIYTDNLYDLDLCEHMMVLLSETTWTSGEASEAYAMELVRAMQIGVECFLIHEVPGARAGDERQSCRFERFFEGDTTPKFLVKAGLYNVIAMNLGPDQWRLSGLIKTVQQLGEVGDQRKPKDVDLGHETARAVSTEDGRVRWAKAVRLTKAASKVAPTPQRDRPSM